MFTVEVEETVTRTVWIEATSAAEARAKAKDTTEWADASEMEATGKIRVGKVVNE